MLCDQDTIYIDTGTMCCGSKPKQDLSALPFARHKEVCLVPEISGIFPDIFFRIKILKTCRHRDHFLSRNPVYPAFVLSNGSFI